MRVRLRSVPLFAAACALALVQRPVVAQGACTGCDSTRSHVFPALGLRVGGVVAGMEWKKYGSDRSRDVALFVEPGLGAGRLSAGYINGIGSMGSGYGFAVTALRSWSQPWSVPKNATYVGGELLILPLYLAGPRIGLFRNVSTGGGRWYFVADLGVGM
jgi:hypothetical protein